MCGSGGVGVQERREIAGSDDAVGVLHYDGDFVPVHGHVEVDAEPAPDADVGRAKESLRVRGDEGLLGALRRGAPERQAVVVVVVREGRKGLLALDEPGRLAVGEALERYVGIEAATKYRAARVVPDAAALYRFLVEAGFGTVKIRPSARTMHLPSLESLVLGHLSGHPVASAVAALSEEQRAALARHVKTALQPYADGDGVDVPDEINIAVAQA